MKLCSKILAIATVAAFTFSLISCAGPSGFSYQNVGITLSVECNDCGVGILFNPAYPQPPNPGSVLLMANAGQGGTVLFTAHVTNAPANITWTLYPTPNLTQPGNLPTGTGLPVGESTAQVGVVTKSSGNTAYYAQNGVPVYSGAALLQAQALGIPQGDVLLVASVPTDPANPSAVATASQLIQIYNQSSLPAGPPSVYLTPRTPTNPANLTESVAFVPRGTSFQFFGGAVGAAPCNAPSPGATLCSNGSPVSATDNGAIWQVGSTVPLAGPCTVASLCPYGTVSPTGLYTAPAVIPPTTTGLLPGQVVVVLAAHGLVTTTAVAYVTVY